MKGKDKRNKRKTERQQLPYCKCAPVFLFGHGKVLHSLIITPPLLVKRETNGVLVCANCASSPFTSRWNWINVSIFLNLKFKLNYKLKWFSAFYFQRWIEFSWLETLQGTLNWSPLSPWKSKKLLGLVKGKVKFSPPPPLPIPTYIFLVHFFFRYQDAKKPKKREREKKALALGAIALLEPPIPPPLPPQYFPSLFFSIASTWVFYFIFLSFSYFFCFYLRKTKKEG